MAEKPTKQETPQWNERREIRSTPETLKALFDAIEDPLIVDKIYQLLEKAFSRFNEFLRNSDAQSAPTAKEENPFESVLTDTYEDIVKMIDEVVKTLKQVKAEELVAAYEANNPSSEPKHPNRVLGTILGDMLTMLSVFQTRFQMHADQGDPLALGNLTYTNLIISDVMTLLETGARNADPNRIKRMRASFLGPQGQLVLDKTRASALTVTRARTETNRRQTIRLTNIPSAFWSLTNLDFEIAKDAKADKGRTFEQSWNKIIDLLNQYTKLEDAIRADSTGEGRLVGLSQYADMTERIRNILISAANEIHIFLTALANLDQTLLERLDDAHMLSAVNGDIYTMLSLIQNVLKLQEKALDQESDGDLKRLNAQVTSDMHLTVSFPKRISHKAPVTEVEKGVRSQAGRILASARSLAA